MIIRTTILRNGITGTRTMMATWAIRIIKITKTTRLLGLLVLLGLRFLGMGLLGLWLSLLLGLLCRYIPTDSFLLIERKDEIVILQFSCVFAITNLSPSLIVKLLKCSWDEGLKIKELKSFSSICRLLLKIVSSIMFEKSLK